MQLAAVQYILDTVVEALDKNPDRKFVYGELVRLHPTVATFIFPGSQAPAELPWKCPT